MKLELLRVFAVTAEQGSLSLAAAQLGRTPSAVSMALAQLEGHIGGSLFESDRKNRLTPLGLLVLEESRRATEAFERSTDAIRRYALSTAGTVRIAAVPSATVTLLPKVVASFRNERPDVRLEISDLDTASVMHRIRLDEADIGIISSSPGDIAAGEVISLDPLGIVCHPEGQIAGAVAAGTSLSWALLEKEPLIANPLCRLVAAPILKDLLGRCNLEARNTTALLAFVKNRLGATVLPEGAMPAISEGLLFLRPTDAPAYRELRKVHGDRKALSPVARAFWRQLG